LFGDGSDGDVKITKPETLKCDMYYKNLTITTGQTLDTGGFRIFVSQKLTLERDARLSRDGIGGDADQVGLALSPGTLGGSTGPLHAISDPLYGWKMISPNIANSLGRSGYPNQAPISGSGSATPPDASVGGGGVFRSALQALSGRSLDGALVNGGAGGCQCNGDRVGGSGGGVVVVAANTIVVLSGEATISANGGPYAGGGVVVVITTISKPTGLKLNADGGLGAFGSGYPGYIAWLNSNVPRS